MVILLSKYNLWEVWWWSENGACCFGDCALTDVDYIIVRVGIWFSIVDCAIVNNGSMWIGIEAILGSISARS